MTRNRAIVLAIVASLILVAAVALLIVMRRDECLMDCGEGLPGGRASATSSVDPREGIKLERPGAVVGLYIELRSASDFERLLDLWRNREFIVSSKNYGYRLTPGRTSNEAVLSWINRPAPEDLDAPVARLKASDGVVNVTVA